MLTLNSRTFVSVQAATGAVFPLSCGAVVKDGWRIENPTYESIKLFPVSNLRPWEMPNTELLIQTALCIYINKNGNPFLFNKVHFLLCLFMIYCCDMDAMVALYRCIVTVIWVTLQGRMKDWYGTHPQDRCSHLCRWLQLGEQTRNCWNSLSLDFLEVLTQITIVLRASLCGKYMSKYFRTPQENKQKHWLLLCLLFEPVLWSSPLGSMHSLKILQGRGSLSLHITRMVFWKTLEYSIALRMARMLCDALISFWQ